jgi:hypothetical protein
MFVFVRLGNHTAELHGSDALDIPAGFDKNGH